MESKPLLLCASDTNLLGHLEIHDLPGVHHDVCGPLLRDAYEALAVHLEQLVARLKPPVVEGRPALHHRLYHKCQMVIIKFLDF